MGDALGGVGRVDGKVGRARLEGGERRDDQVCRAGQGDRHEPLGARAQFEEAAGQPVGTLVEFTVGQGSVRGLDGEVVRAVGGVLGDVVGEGAVHRTAGRVVPLDQDAVQFPGAEHVHLADAPAGIGDQRAQEPQEPLHQQRDRALVEQVRAVLGRAHQSAGRAVGVPVLGEFQGEVQLGDAGGHVQQAHAEAGGGERREGVLLGGVQAQQHLEERVVGERPGRREDVHQVLEGQVLVVVGAQVGVPHPVEELPEGGVAARVGAQHQGVDEEADDLVHGVVAAARHRGAQGDVVARAQPGQQGRQGRLEHHEDAGAGLPGQRHRATVQVGGDGQRDPAAAVRGDGRQRPVRGQFEPVRQPGQGLLPVRELPAGGAGGVGGVPERGALPQGEVRVLHGQRRPVGGVAGRAGRVGGGQVADQRTEGPAVTGDVVDHQQQHVLVGAEPEQLRAHRDVGRQVEAVPGGLFEPAAEQVLGEVGDRQFEAHGRGVEDGLPGAPRVLREDGPQALVAYDDVLEGRAQRLGDEGARQPQRSGDVVGGGGALELVQEPQPLLGVGQGQPLRARPGRQRRPGPLGPVEGGGEPGDGRALEQPAHGQFDAQGAADAGGQPGREQGVAAEVEEAVVHGQPGYPEDLGEQRAQDLLARPARGASGDLPRVGGGGQRLGVELAVGRQRERVQRDERRRQHVVGDVSGGVVVQCAGGRAGAGHHVRDEPRVALDVLPRHHGDVVDGGVGGEHGLDLAGLDAEAADLHLLVGAAQVVQAAVGAAPGQVAGAVHAGAVLAEQGGVRVGGEAVRGERRAAQVAAGQSRAGHVHLAGDAGRGGAQPVVEDVDAQVGDVDADRARRRGRGRGPVQGDVRDVHGGLGDAVHVDQGRRVLGVPFVPVGQPGQVQGLTAEHHRAQREFVAALPVRGGQLVERGRRLVEDGDPLAGEQGQEGGGVPADVVRDDDEPAAVQQRTPQLPHREVEGVRVEQRPHVVLVEAEPLLGGGEEPHDVAVRHGHTLGAAGRAGGVDDVGGVPRVEGPDPLALREVGGRVGPRRVAVRVRRVVAEDDEGHLVGGQAVGGGAVGEQGGGGGVGQRVGEPVGRVAGVQRDVGGARLDHREQRHDQLGRAGQGEGDQRVGADAARRQQPGQAVGPGVEVGVGERGAFEGQRGATRVPGGLPLEQLGQRGGDGCGGNGGAVRPVGRHQQVVVFAGEEHVDIAEPCARVGGDLREQPQQPLGEGADGRGVEQFGAELHREVQPGVPALRVPPLVEGEHEVEPGQSGVHRQQRRADPGQPAELAQGVLPAGVEGQHHLEQRVVGGGPVRVDRLHESLEGHVLVGVGGQVALADATEQFAEGGVAAGVGAQHERVDEEADQVLHRRVGAARDGRADRYVRAGAEPRQQPRERGLEHHEDAGPGLAGQRGERAVQAGGHRHVEAGAGVVAAHGARPVGGQLQPLRQSGERRAPVRELPGALAAALTPGLAPRLVVARAEQFALPERVVGVLHRQRRPVGGPAGRPGGVGGAEVTGEGRQRPAVARDVVQDEQEDTLLGRHPQQRGPQRHVPREVEAVPRGAREVVGQPLRGAVQRLQTGRDLFGGQDHLVGAVRVLGEDCAQALVPGHHVREGVRERGLVHPAGKPQRRRDVVQRRGPFVLVDEPQAPLREGQRQPLGARPGGDRRTGPPGLLQRRGQLRDARRLEDPLDRHLRAGGGADAADQPGGEQRVAAQLEEVVVHADLVDAQHLGEQRAQQLLVRRARGPSAGPLGARGGGQGPAVELAVGGDRQPGQGDEGGGHHVAGQQLAQARGERGGVRLRAGRGNGVGDETLVAGTVLAQHDGGLVDLRLPYQRRLDLAEFDPEAAQLHLVVGAAEVVEAAVVVPAREVAGAVHPAAGNSVRVGGEAFGAEAGAAQVAAGELHAGDVQLAGHAGRDRAQRGVEHVHPGVPHRASDRHRTVAGVLGARPVRHVDGGLGRPVQVVQRYVRHGAEAGAQLRREGLTAAEHPAQSAQRGRGRLPQEHVEHRRHEVQGGHARAADGVGQVGRVQVALGPGHDQGGALDEGPEELPHGHVEAGGCLLQHPVGRFQAVGVLHPGQAVDDRPVGDDHALGAPGGPGGVDDVGRVVGAGRGRGCGRGGFRDGGRVVEEQPGRAVLRQPLLGVPRGQDEHRARVPQDVRDAVGRVAGVDGHVRRARPEHREERHDQLGRAGHGDRDEALRARAPGGQRTGQPLGACVEFGVRQGGALVDDGLVLRGARGPRGEQLGQGRGGHLARGVVPAVEDEVPLVGREQRDVVDPGRGVRRQVGQEPDEAFLQRVQVLDAVHLRVALEVDAEAGLGGAGQHDGQVGRRTRTDAAHQADRTAEVHRPDVRHDVDGGSRHPRAAQLPVEVLAAVAAVRHQAAHRPGHVLDHPREAVAGLHGQPQRQPVGDHAGRRPGVRAVAAGDRHGHHDVPGTRHPVHEGAHAGDHHALPVRAGRLGGPAEHARALRAEGQAPHGRRQRPGADPAGERDGLGAVGEQAGPVGPVPLVPRRAAVGLLTGDHPVRVPEGVGGDLVPVPQRPVHLGQPLVEQRHAGAVDHDVVDAQVVHVPAAAQREQRVAAEAGPVQGHRRRTVPLHPPLGLALGVRVVREVDVVQQHGRVRHVVRALDGVRTLRRGRAVRAVRVAVLVGEEAGAERLRLGHGVPQGRAQQRVVQRPVDLQAGSRLVVRAARIQLLREPHLVLRAGQTVPDRRLLRHLSPHNPLPEPPASQWRAVKQIRCSPDGIRLRANWDASKAARRWSISLSKRITAGRKVDNQPIARLYG